VSLDKVLLVAWLDSPQLRTALQDWDRPSTIYAAVRPTGREPELQGEFPNLSVQLRPYQRRAAAWMVAREVRNSLHSRCSISSAVAH